MFSDSQNRIAENSPRAHMEFRIEIRAVTSTSQRTPRENEWKDHESSGSKPLRADQPVCVYPSRLRRHQLRDFLSLHPKKLHRAAAQILWRRANRRSRTRRESVASGQLEWKSWTEERLSLTRERIENLSLTGPPVVWRFRTSRCSTTRTGYAERHFNLSICSK